MDDTEDRPHHNARLSRLSQQLRLKVRVATLWRLHHISLYRRLILFAKDKGARTKHSGTAIYMRLQANYKEGKTLPNFV